ncbi:hypothetical protein SRHO_G00078930 [Serrasalmus rhombeus]
MFFRNLCARLRKSITSVFRAPGPLSAPQMSGPYWASLAPRSPTYGDAHTCHNRRIHKLRFEAEAAERKGQVMFECASCPVW